MSRKPELRLAVVGCGAIAESVHIPVTKEFDELRLVALVDSDIGTVRDSCARHGVFKYGTTIREVARDVDVVVICTPPHTHKTIALEAFEAGLHVLCEKPFANSVGDCDAIINAAEEANRILAVAHVFRFWPSRQTMREIITSEEFGKVKSVTVTQGKPYSWQTLTGYNMRLGLVPGGVLFDAGIHPLDTILWWFGEPEILEYQDDSLGGLESNVRLSMRFPTAPIVRFRQSRTAPMTNEFRIETEGAALLLSNYSPTEIRIVRDGQETVRHSGDVQTNHRTCERAQLQDFVDSIREARTPFVSGQAGRDVVDLIERCYAMKAQCGMPAKAPLPGLTRSYR